MDNEIERLRQNAKYEIERIERRLATLEKLPIELVKHAFPEGSWSEYFGGDYQFTLPMRFDLVAQFKKFCTAQGFQDKFWQRFVWDKDNAGDFCDCYVTEDLSFRVAFRSTAKGSTCVIQKIGEELKPIYEAVCADGAQENVFFNG